MKFRTPEMTPIVYNARGLKMFLHLRGTALQHCWLRVLLVGLIGVPLVLLKHFDVFDLSIGVTAHTLIGFVMSLMLVFRTNSCYERWRDGRVLLGQLVNRSRNLVLNACVLLSGDATKVEFFRRKIQSLAAAYVFAVKNNLQFLPSAANLDELLTDTDFAFLTSQADLKTMPQMCALWLEQAINQAFLEDLVSEYSCSTPPRFTCPPGE
eukprot:TRINITY_DN1068_c0_g1_i1.p1 TRINITY_DN1068_c0_g1~~TRINITY_DN1068_c0_g1_i1.p1  ORF type:complete len:224 (-),score=56.34 TRINITY_DN1068_c0_g1_i1:645-1271(-)